MYQLILDPLTGQLANNVLRLADNAYIPFDPDNIDYQAYLAWLNEGNTPLPPDPIN
jgi:hypothetical protein